MTGHDLTLDHTEGAWTVGCPACDEAQALYERMIARPLDVGPIHVNTGAGERYAAAWCEGFDEGWSQASRSRLGPHLLALLLIVATAIALGVVVGWMVGTAYAAPRPPAQQGLMPPAYSVYAEPERRTGAPHGEAAPGTPGAEPATTSDPAQQAAGGAPPTAVTIPPACWPGPCDANWLVRTGDASTYGPGWDGWTAIPEGPGYRIRVCGPADCAELLTTDAGPDQRIHPDRVVDLDVPTFEDVCGVPWRMGTCPVSVTILRVPHG
ncbi:MAG TPA: hypothetical protein VGQ58_04210 [Candidatus Limnocylindrales bacterium]|jgi:hypothetical protein|nr:hypothetical protein [Candidatus Limnocylindrales bacterium]